MAEWLWRVAQDDIHIFFGQSNLSELSHRETCRGSNPLLLINIIFIFTWEKPWQNDLQPFRLAHDGLLR